MYEFILPDKNIFVLFSVNRTERTKDAYVFITLVSVSTCLRDEIGLTVNCTGILVMVV